MTVSKLAITYITDYFILPICGNG